MKTCKHILSISLVLCTILTLLPGRASAAEVASGICGEHVSWSFDGAGTLTISGTGNMTEYSLYSEVPWYSYRESIYNAVIMPGVTSVAPYCFWRDTNLKSVSIPEGVTKIGRVCFLACENLTSVNLPRSLQQIDDLVFSDCSNLVTVGSIANVSKIGDHAFTDCSSLVSIDISSKVTGIFTYTFAGCLNLSNVGDLSSVTQIGGCAFRNCTNLQTINSLANVTKYGDEAFSGCISLSSVGKVNSSATVGKNVFYNCNKLAQREILDPDASIHDMTSDWSKNNASRIGWINIGTCPANPGDFGSKTEELVNTLCVELTDNLSKAKVLYAWVVDNICYDYDKYDRPGMTAWLITETDKAMLKAAGGSEDMFHYASEDIPVILKRGVCGDICWTYATMLRVAGIPAFSESCEIGFNTPPHACVMAYLNGEWRFFDPTWDARGIYTEKTYHFAPSSGNWSYFNMDLQQFSKGHFFAKDVGVIAENTPSDWAQGEVWQAQLAGLVPTKLQSSYRENITRAEFCRLMVVLVEKSVGMNIDSYLKFRNITISNPFIDTNDDDAVAAYALGVVSGTTHNTFSPERTITRQEAATMLARTAKVLGLSSEKGENFNDVGLFASWASESIAFVSGLSDPTTGSKVISGTGGGMFSPLAFFTREQAILTVLRIYHCCI